MVVSVLVLPEETARQDKNAAAKEPTCSGPDEGAAVALQKEPDVLQNDSSFTVALFKPHKSYS